LADSDELIIKIGADFAELKSQLKKASEKVDDFGDDAKKTGGKVDKATKKMGQSFKTAAKGAAVAGAAIAAMSVAVGALTKAVLGNSQELDLWSRRLNVGVKEFSKLSGVGAMFGATVDDVGDAIKDLNERIADAASGNKTYEEAFTRMGLASKDLINLPVEEQFLRVAEAISKMTNQGKKNFVVADLMADAGFRLLPMLEQGRNGIEKLSSEVESLGGAMTESQAKDLRKYNLAMAKMAIVTESLGRELVLALQPALDWLASDGVGHINDFRLSLEKLFGVLDDGSGSARMVELKKIKEEIDELTRPSKDDKGDSFFSSGVDQKEEAALEKLRQRRAELRAMSDEDFTAKEKKKDKGNGEPEEILNVQKSIETKALEMADAFRAQMNAADFDHRAKKHAIKEGEWDDLRSLQEQYQRDTFESERKAQLAQRVLWESGWKGKMKVTQGIMGQLSTLMASENRKMFETGKAAATANAIIDTISSAQAAYKAMAGIPVVGPALGAAAAGAAIAAGTARVQQIQSTTMGGGGGGVGAGGAGGGDVGAGVESGGTQETINQTNFDITLQGQSYSSEQVRSLIGSINDEVDNGARVGSITVQ